MRLAAGTVADRISEDIGRELGQAIAYARRFTDRVRDTTIEKRITNDSGLTDINRDRDLPVIDTILIANAKHDMSARG